MRYEGLLECVFSMMNLLSFWLIGQCLLLLIQPLSGALHFLPVEDSRGLNWTAPYPAIPC